MNLYLFNQHHMTGKDIVFLGAELWWWQGAWWSDYLK